MSLTNKWENTQMLQQCLWRIIIGNTGGRRISSKSLQIALRGILRIPMKFMNYPSDSQYIGKIKEISK